MWGNPRQILDQGSTPHCVGSAHAQWGNTDPVNDSYTQSDADAIYYEAKIIDGEPGEENGSSTLSGTKAMKNRGRTEAYAFARSVDEIKEWVLTDGPVVTGTDWTASMFDLVDGYLVPTGRVEGGHDWLIVGYDGDRDAFVMQNSWGPWGDVIEGVSGRAYIRVSDYAQLFAGIDYAGDASFMLESDLP